MVSVMSPHVCNGVGDASGDAMDVFQAKVIESISVLREDVDALRLEQRHVKTTRSLPQNAPHNAPRTLPQNAPQNTPVKLCSLYVRVNGRCHESHAGKSGLESLLGCSVTVCAFGGCSFPIFQGENLGVMHALPWLLGSKAGCFVARWNDSSGSGCSLTDVHLTDVHLSSLSKTKKKSHKGVKMSCWNCRGLSSSLPYLIALIDPDEGSTIVVLSEHWLWPYDLHKLNNINDKYDAVGKSDCRLTEDRDGGRGCGGIGILWHKSIAASPIPGIGSDRICGIRFSMDDGDNSAVSVIGVYLPCLDQGVDCHREHLVELERVISDS